MDIALIGMTSFAQVGTISNQTSAIYGAAAGVPGTCARIYF